MVDTIKKSEHGSRGGGQQLKPAHLNNADLVVLTVEDLGMGSGQWGERPYLVFKEVSQAEGLVYFVNKTGVDMLCDKFGDGESFSRNAILGQRIPLVKVHEARPVAGDFYHIAGDEPKAWDSLIAKYDAAGKDGGKGRRR